MSIGIVRYPGSNCDFDALKFFDGSYFIYHKLNKKTRHAVSTPTQWGYGIHDYKTGKLFLIEYISSGRWKFLGKHFNKLDDINKKKAYLINKHYKRA